MNLLVVDDFVEIRQMLKSMFGEMFDETYEAEDGNLGVELYKKHKPDWVLMDIKMDVMDGITATKLIKEFDKKAKVIIVTLYKDEETSTEAKNAGAFGLVSKDDLSKIGDMIFESIL
ncbi:MAG: response regulator [Ignavibacteriales bacterium]|nr:response regulator [Ignavibacteriales bacterium]